MTTQHSGTQNQDHKIPDPKTRFEGMLQARFIYKQRQNKYHFTNNNEIF